MSITFKYYLNIGSTEPLVKDMGFVYCVRILFGHLSFPAVYKENAKKVKKVAFQVIDFACFFAILWRGI